MDSIHTLEQLASGQADAWVFAGDDGAVRRER
jgi:hypothetical protein